MAAFLVLSVVLCSSKITNSLQLFLSQSTLVRGDLFVDVLIETVFLFVYPFVD